MADPRTSFMILEDSATQAGVPLHKIAEGNAVSGKNALPAMVAKDPSGNFVYLKSNAAGQLLIDQQAQVICKKAQGELAAGSATIADVTSAAITLTADKSYQNVGFIVSCRRDALFQIVQVNDATETILGEIVVGSGAYTISSQLHCLSFTSGSTGTQSLKIVAKNFEALSSLRASITVEEII